MKLDQLADIVMGNIFGKYIESFWGTGSKSRAKFDESIVFYSFERVHWDNQK